MRITAVTCEQAGRQVHVSNLYEIPMQQLFELDRPCVASGIESIFPTNVSANTVVKVLLPLVIAEQQANILANVAPDLMQTFCRALSAETN